MRVNLFDVQAEFGSAVPGNKSIVTCEELKADMYRLSIDRALVRIGPEELSVDHVHANQRLYERCSVDKALVPCPVVVPNTAHDLLSEEEQVAEALGHGAGAVFLRPGHDHWSLDPWVSDRLFTILQAKHMPVFCLERMIGVSAVADLATRYPALPIIFAEGNYRTFRLYLPLLEKFKNVHFSLGNNFHVHRGIEKMLETVKVEQLLFGTGFPRAEPMAAVTQLMYADLPDKMKNRIGSGNMERLMKGIAHE